MYNMDLVKVIESENIRNQYPEVEVGDFVKAHLLIKEGAKERIQVFEGYVDDNAACGFRLHIQGIYGKYDL